MTTPTPAAELRAAAATLREATGHATPGPWRPHDTWPTAAATPPPC